MVVTATGMQTQMGQIATMLTLGHPDALAAAEGARLADQGARDHRVGRRRVHRRSSASRAARTSPTCCCSGRRWRSPRSRPGMPAFVSGLLSLGAKQLADAKAVVKNLTDVETLGATSAINTDKTGTLTMNQMMVSVIYADGAWFYGRGRGLPQDRRDHVGRGGAGSGLHAARARARARQRRDGRRRRVGGRRSDRGRAGRARGEARRRRGGDAPGVPARWPRCRSIPTTSSWRRSTAYPSTEASA